MKARNDRAGVQRSVYLVERKGRQAHLFGLVRNGRVRYSGSYFKVGTVDLTFSEESSTEPVPAHRSFVGRLYRDELNALEVSLV